MKRSQVAQDINGCYGGSLVGKGWRYEEWTSSNRNSLIEFEEETVIEQRTTVMVEEKSWFDPRSSVTTSGILVFYVNWNPVSYTNYLLLSHYISLMVMSVNSQNITKKFYTFFKSEEI